ncbi:MAG: hypothetical protein ACLGJB_18320 [Blastocatellia bacterium]
MANRKVIFTSRLKEGAEQQLMHDLKTIFPSEALRGIEGLEEVTVCQGSGRFAAIIEYDGDFEKIFASYVSNPSVQAFHAKMAQYLVDVPTSKLPADLPLMGDVMVWDGKKVQEAAG